jgi:hypothetical protein
LGLAVLWGKGEHLRPPNPGLKAKQTSL